MRFLLVLPAVVLLAGCGGSSKSSSSSEPSGNVMQTVQISEKEYSLTPGTVTVSKPGTYAFHVTNKGTITHALEVEGNGVEEESGDIQAGSSATLKVTFTKNGSYEMYCPIDGHKAQGMKGTLTVGSTGGTGDTTSTENETTSTSKTRGY
jgi:plastocyanin